jgi:hypothetical protein
LANHTLVLELLETSGWITAETRTVAQTVLNKLSFFSGDQRRRVFIPVRIEQGKVFVALWHVATLRAPATE